MMVVLPQVGLAPQKEVQKMSKDFYIELITEALRQCDDVELLDLVYKLLCRQAVY